MDLLQGVTDGAERALADEEAKNEGGPLGGEALEAILKELGASGEGGNEEIREKLMKMLEQRGGNPANFFNPAGLKAVTSQNFSVEMMMLFGLLSVIFLVLGESRHSFTYNWIARFVITGRLMSLF